VTVVGWVAAQEESGVPVKSGRPSPPHGTKHTQKATSRSGIAWQGLPVHNFPSGTVTGRSRREESGDSNSELWVYRDRTMALLRRYLRASLQTGRLPSIVGREFFRASVTSYRSLTFEDRVIFVHDVEKILKRLEHWDQQLIVRVVLQEHTHDKAANLLRCCRKTIQRRLPEVLDLLSADFLEVGLLVALPPEREDCS